MSPVKRHVEIKLSPDGVRIVAETIGDGVFVEVCLVCGARNVLDVAGVEDGLRNGWRETCDATWELALANSRNTRTMRCGGTVEIQTTKETP